MLNRNRRCTECLGASSPQLGWCCSTIQHKVKLPIEIGEPTEFFAAPIQQLDSKADAGAFAIHPKVFLTLLNQMLSQVQQCFVKLCFDIKTQRLMLCTPRSLLALYSCLDYWRLLRTHHRTEICCRQLRSSHSYMWPHIMAAGLVIEQQENPRFEKLFKWLKNTQPYPAIVDIVLESNTHQKWRNERRRHSSLDFRWTCYSCFIGTSFLPILANITRRLFLDTLQIFHRIGRDDLSFV